jgi:hypothetical protein
MKNIPNSTRVYYSSHEKTTNSCEFDEKNARQNSQAWVTNLEHLILWISQTQILASKQQN